MSVCDLEISTMRRYGAVLTLLHRKKKRYLIVPVESLIAFSDSFIKGYSITHRNTYMQTNTGHAYIRKVNRNYEISKQKKLTHK